MPLTDILTSGQQAITTPTSSTAEKVLPDWYTNYAMDVLSGQQAIANQPLATYSGPRVADLTPLQQQAIQQTQQVAGAYQPALDTATQVTQGALGISPSQMAQPYMSAAAAPATANIQQYMNPYQSDVVNQIATLGTRNLMENILPSISDKFIAGGSYGGSRNAEIMGRAIRDAQTGISNAQAQALSQGYSGALGAAQTDAARQVQLASLAGSQGATDIASQLQGAQQLAGLGQAAQSLGLTGAGALGQAGALQQNINQQNLTNAYQDFLRQQGYPQQVIDSMTKTLGAVAPAVPFAQQQQGTSIAGYTPSTAASILGALSALGSPTVQSGLNTVGGALGSIFGGGSSGSGGIIDATAAANDPTGMLSLGLPTD